MTNDYDSLEADLTMRKAEIHELRSRLALAEAYIEALEQNLNDFVDLKTMDEATAWRAA